MKIIDRTLAAFERANLSFGLREAVILSLAGIAIASMLTASAAAVIATEIFRIVPSLSLLFARSAVGGALDRAGRGVCVGAAALTRSRASAEYDLSALDHLPFRFGVLAVTPNRRGAILDRCPDRTS